MNLMWRKLGRQLLYQTRHFKIFREPHSHDVAQIEHPFVVLETRDWVQVIAVDTDSLRRPEARLLWVEQFRVGPECTTLEIPGGALEEEDVDPLLAAKRELLEETGARAGRWLYLGNFSSNPALFRNRVHAFLAFGCQLDSSVVLGDGSEVLDVQWHPFKDRFQMLLNKKVDHGLVAGALALLEAHLQSGDSRL